MLLHLLAERIAISSELDPNAAIVLSWSGFELFCEEKAKHHINNGPKILVSCNNIEIIIMRLGRSLENQLVIICIDYSRPVLKIPLGRVLKELPKFSHL